MKNTTMLKISILAAVLLLGIVSGLSYLFYDAVTRRASLMEELWYALLIALNARSLFITVLVMLDIAREVRVDKKKAK